MTVRAKYKVSAKESTLGSGKEEMVTIKMNPVINGSKENEEFFKYTPAGEFRLGTLNKKAAEYFQLGEEYYVDFTKAE